MLKVNLGCGYKPRKGFINCDIISLSHVDKVFDLETSKYPFKDSSVELIILEHVMEHLTNIDYVLKECDRILCDNGTLSIKVPHHSNSGSYQEYHKTHYSIYSFDFPNWQRKMLSIYLSKRCTKILFERIFFYERFAEWFFNLPKMQVLYEKTILNSLFPAKTIKYLIRK